MKLILVASTAVLVLSSSLFGDSVNSATGSFSPFSSGFAASTPVWQGALTQPTTMGSPFWNNPSDDVGVGGSHDMNVGYVLTDSGGLAGTPAVLGSDTVTSELTAAGGMDPTAFSFVSETVGFNLATLFAQSSLDTGNSTQGTVFGYYVGSTYTPIETVSDSSSPNLPQVFDTTEGSSYGFYATVCYGPGMCETYTTGNGNSGNVSGAAGWNHFALFQLASGNYVLGFTATDANVGEGIGDFNDIVVEFAPVPEPGTFGAMILGLAGIAYLVARRHRMVLVLLGPKRT